MVTVDFILGLVVGAFAGAVAIAMLVRSKSNNKN